MILRHCRTTIRFCSFRSLSLYEYQCKKILNENNLNVQRFQLVDNPQDAKRVGEQLMKTIANELMIKAQILADGRAEFTKDPNECAKIVEQMLKHGFVTKQTSSKSIEVKKVIVAEALDIVRKTYLAFLLDRTYGGAVLMGSPIGGVDIEEVIEKHPDQIFTILLDPFVGLRREQALEMVKILGFEKKLANEAVDQIQKLYKLFIKYDCTKIEINPFVETSDQRVMNFDVKLIFDDNAKFRQTNIFNLEDTSESDRCEIEAKRAGFNYIGLQGNIGCLVNGAGLAMATMDLIKQHGGQPANFLDIGSIVKEDQLLHAFQILVDDNQVKAVLINIFGGIVNCEIIANGIERSCEKLNLKIPLVVRLQGTNMNEAHRILTRIRHSIIVENDLERAAAKVVSFVQNKC